MSEKDVEVEVHYISPEEVTAAPKISPVQKEVHSALWLNCILPGDNEWTTWSDAIVLTEVAIAAVPDGWGKTGGKWVRIVAAPTQSKVMDIRPAAASDLEAHHARVQSAFERLLWEAQDSPAWQANIRQWMQDAEDDRKAGRRYRGIRVGVRA